MAGAIKMSNRKEDEGSAAAASVTDIRTKKKRPGKLDRTGIPATPRQAEVLAKGRAAGKARGVKRQAARDSEQDGPSRWEMFRAGKLPLEEWDLEELARMQPKNFHGQFAGRPPVLQPREVRAIQSELVRRSNFKFHEYGPKAIRIVYKIMVDPEVDPAIRLRAANIFIERAYGKIPETVKMAVVEAWKEDVEAVMSIWSGEDTGTE